MNELAFAAICGCGCRCQPRSPAAAAAAAATASRSGSEPISRLDWRLHAASLAPHKHSSGRPAKLLQSLQCCRCDVSTAKKISRFTPGTFDKLEASLLLPLRWPTLHSSRPLTTTTANEAAARRLICRRRSPPCAQTENVCTVQRDFC